MTAQIIYGKPTRYNLPEEVSSKFDKFDYSRLQDGVSTNTSSSSYTVYIYVIKNDDGSVSLRYKDDVDTDSLMLKEVQVMKETVSVNPTKKELIQLCGLAPKKKSKKSVSWTGDQIYVNCGEQKIGPVSKVKIIE